jgi:hypothetical protein
MAAVVGAGAEPVAQADRDRDIETARAVDRVRVLLQRVFEEPFPELAEIRQQQKIFLKASHKYPEFIEVGIDVWERVSDWHVRHQLPLNVVRRDDGRYSIAFMFTTLVLRPDQADAYVSFGYDAR